MSNIVNLQAAAEADRVIFNQGWTKDEYLRVLCDYITLYQLWPQALAYMQERARQENEEKGAS